MASVVRHTPERNELFKFNLISLNIWIYKKSHFRETRCEHTFFKNIVI